VPPQVRSAPAATGVLPRPAGERTRELSGSPSSAPACKRRRRSSQATQLHGGVPTVSPRLAPAWRRWMWCELDAARPSLLPSVDTSSSSSYHHSTVVLVVLCHGGGRWHKPSTRGAQPPPWGTGHHPDADDVELIDRYRGDFIPKSLYSM
jgi:hypothetical protein